jgi:DNA-binding response OmpR family regulator
MPQLSLFHRVASMSNSGPEQDKALAVDKSPLVAETVSDLLNNAGFDAEHTTQYQEAQESVSSQPLDVLVADIPPSHPQPAVELVRSADQADAAVVVTTSQPPADLPELPPDTVVLQKPFGKQELLDAVDEAQQNAQQGSSTKPD